MPACAAIAIRKAAVASTCSADLDILGLPIGAHQPGLDSVVVINRVDAANLSQCVLGRLQVAGGIVSTRLDEQLLALPVEIDVEARERFLEDGAVNAGLAPVAPSVERHIDARDP